MALRMRPWWVLLFATICASLEGLQPILLLTWMQPFLVLEFLHRSRAFQGLWRRRIAITSVAVITQAFGYTVSYAGMLNKPDFTLGGVALIFSASLLGWSLLIVAFICDATFRNVYPAARLSQPLVFPAIWTALWHLAIQVLPLGSIGNPAYSQTGLRPMIMTAALLGVDGINFLIAWTAAVCHDDLFRREQAREDNLNIREWTSLEIPLISHVYGCGVIFCLTLVLGGGRETFLGGTFYQRNLVEYFEPVLPASCILGVELEGMGQERLWEQTATRLTAGDAIVLWSEKAALVRGEVGEEELLRRAGSLALESSKARIRFKSPHLDLPSSPTDSVPGIEWSQENISTNSERRLLHDDEPMSTHQKIVSTPYAVEGTEGPYLGVSFRKEMVSGGGKSWAESRFCLVGPTGEALFCYSKSHPCWFTEPGVVAGPKTLKAVESPWGMLGAAVSSDLDFPGFMRQAAAKGVDLLLEPCESWGPVGPYQHDAHGVRAVENGFTLFRCTSNGISGVTSPLYRVHSWREGLESGVIRVDIPTAHYMWTMYPAVGHLFGWLVSIMAIIYAALCLGPFTLAFIPSLTIRGFLVGPALIDPATASMSHYQSNPRHWSDGLRGLRADYQSAREVTPPSPGGQYRRENGLLQFPKFAPTFSFKGFRGFSDTELASNSSVEEESGSMIEERNGSNDTQ